jgi:hypothetical protein
MLDHDTDSYEKISRAFTGGQASGGLTVFRRDARGVPHTALREARQQEPARDAEDVHRSAHNPQAKQQKVR